MKNIKKALGTYDIAKICHVTPPTVGHWIEEGKLPSFTTGGGHRRILSIDLVRFLKIHNIPPPPELAAVISNPVVLIVDDEPRIRSIVGRILRSAFAGFDIHEAGDGFQAGFKVTRLRPSLVILDLKLPGIDGFEICRMIRHDQDLKEVRILAISGHGGEETKKEALKAGADDFLAKPFESKELLAKLSGFLSLFSARQVGR
ncbi:MAG: response regulator [Elusimicrobia bacterium]|nr:response regulator [Elusimicrobiota bacterium]